MQSPSGSKAGGCKPSWTKTLMRALMSTWTIVWSMRLRCCWACLGNNNNSQSWYLELDGHNTEYPPCGWKEAATANFGGVIVNNTSS